MTLDHLVEKLYLNFPPDFLNKYGNNLLVIIDHFLLLSEFTFLDSGLKPW